jgi:glycosyltransferase involved in cell wall biosynthesis
VHVGVVVEQLVAPVPGGTGRWTRELARALAATAGEGDRVSGWCAWRADTRPAGVPAVAGPVRLALPRRGLALAWERGWGPRVGADVVVAPTVLAPPLRSGQPLLATIHDAVPWTHPETLTRRGVAFHRRCAQRILATAAVILVPTAAVRDELGRHLELPLERVAVLPSGVSAAVASVPADAAARRRRLAVPVGPYLLAIGTLEPRKGLDIAFEALAMLHRRGEPAPPLLLAGPVGWGGLDAVQQASAAGVPAGQVRVLGPLADPDLAAVLSAATALVMPSRSEGFGLPLLEAMAHGVPAVTSDAPALVEVGGGATVVAAVGDAAALAAALARVLADGALRDELAALGRRRAAQFDWTTTATRLWQLCHSARRPAAGPVPA